MNTNTPNAFDYLLTSSKDVSEVKKLAKKINLLANMDGEATMGNHFFFYGQKGRYFSARTEGWRITCL